MRPARRTSAGSQGRPRDASTPSHGLRGRAPASRAISSNFAVRQDPWRLEGEIAASLFFGNTSQATVNLRSALERADSLRELGVDGSFTYGEATDPETERAFVTRRSWAAGGSYDHRPLARLSPFLFTRVERSLEKRIDLRTEAGVGTKYTLVRSDQGQLDLSVAALVERTEPANGAEDPDVLARWSLRLRARKTTAGGRLMFSSETFWRPRLGDPEVFTLATTQSLAAQFTERISLKLTFVDKYDSEATTRGARSNNDGQLLLGVLSSL